MNTQQTGQSANKANTPLLGPKTQALKAPGVSGRQTSSKNGKARGKLSASLWIGLTLVAIVTLAALISFIWTPYDPVQADATARLQGPGPAHPLGTDDYGRDLLSAMLYGARITLLVGIISVGIALVIGTPLGIIAGIRGGWLEEMIMRSSDIMLAFPALLLAIMTTAVFGASTLTAMLAIGVSTIPAFARVARSGTLQVMNTEYVLAARAASQSRLKIALRHVTPNIFGIVIVQCSVSFALAVLAEAGLSFLGLGTPPPTPSWGRMLQESQSFLAVHPLMAILPGTAIALAVMGFNLLGDGLRDRFDPKLTEGKA